ncbi:orotidine 5'-phosphate decarboxylase / HUMPS family protein [Paenibacillus riograndensis]|uniref:Orotidine 5'-phosphate decarboxylase n=1 Tax=Paenibacillus riograndensis SBR5 TaxID=1073571 RepID=A0A0E4CX45_9BACL|nr:orotidine 5'-phosphate decarboxylase / HUMPS family protein [Paenibacillus riograndensis]CQR55970.1 orotidine 5'-phosphate decarboxylase [Paenibacillus riograndensis SBR5]
MNIQLALDRMSIQEAIDMARLTEPYIDWIEVGTSLIKEFGMASVEAMKREFPHKVIVADVKTFDNAKYEFELCYKAGADVATVMGAAPLVTVDLSMKTARIWDRQVMIDLLHTMPEEQAALARYWEAVHCLHVSKDQQEGGGSRLAGPGAYGAALDGAPGSAGESPAELRIAAAGGITLESLPGLMAMKPEVLIVGSAITKAPDPAAAARAFQDRIRELGRR